MSFCFVLVFEPITTIIALVLFLCFVRTGKVDELVSYVSRINSIVKSLTSIRRECQISWVFWGSNRTYKSLEIFLYPR